MLLNVFDVIHHVSFPFDTCRWGCFILLIEFVYVREVNFSDVCFLFGKIMHVLFGPIGFML